MSIFKKKEVAEGDIDPSASSKSFVSMETAHRDVQYIAPNPLFQMFSICKTQLLFYSKNRVSLIVLLAIALVMPVLVLTGLFGGSMISSSEFMGNMLSLSELLILFAMMFFCGAALSQEFYDGTGRLHFPLPVPRWAFYYGKFLASLIASVVFAIFMFSLAWLITGFNYSVIEGAKYSESFLLMLLCCFMCNGINFAIGAAIRRSGGISFALLFMVMPMAMLLLHGFTEDFNLVSSIVSWLPFTPLDMVTMNLGVPPVSLAGLGLASMVYGVPVGDCMTVCVVWGAAFLALGHIIMFKKEVR